MGKKSTPKTPAAPDYAGAATAQGEANIDAARAGAEMTNTNQYTPYGSQVFTKSPGSDQWSSTVSLSPEQQHLYDLQTQGDTALGETANSQLGRVQSSMSQPLDVSGAPARVNSVDGANYSMYGGGSPSYQRSGSAPSYADFSGNISQLPDYGNQAKEVEDSLYRSATTRLDPQFQRDEEAMRSRLLNSGVAENSEQYRNAFDDFNRSKQTAYGDARDRAIQGRGAEQSRLNNDFYTGNAQQFGQTLSRDTFNNSSKQQQFADALRGADFNNSATQQEFSDTLRGLGFNNDASSRQFADDVTAGNFQNQNRGAAIDEAAYMRNDPLNMYNALSSGAQVTNPQFRGTGNVASPGAAPTFAATQAADQRAVDLYNARLASSGSAQSGLFGMLGNLGGAAINQWSDRRLKTNIERIGTLTDGLPIYSYEIFGKPETGVMADEVREVYPEAVTRQPNGYDMVDYSQIKGLGA